MIRKTIFRFREWRRIRKLQRHFGNYGRPIFWWDEKAHLGLIFFRNKEMCTFSLPYGLVVGACEIKTPADRQEADLCNGLNIDWQQFEFDA